MNGVGGSTIITTAAISTTTRPAERTHSVVLYLETPERGGETRFPLLDLSVKSLSGRLLIWSNLDSSGQSDPTCCMRRCLC